MRGAFTLIELMVTILISTIFLNFISIFYLNTFREVQELYGKSSLIYGQFRAMEIMRGGVSGVDGIITLDTIGTDNNFTSNRDGNSVQIRVDGDDLILKNSVESFRFGAIDIYDGSLTLKHLADNLYLIEFTATADGTDVDTIFQRLIYTR